MIKVCSNTIYRLKIRVEHFVLIHAFEKNPKINVDVCNIIIIMSLIYLQTLVVVFPKHKQRISHTTQNEENPNRYDFRFVSIYRINNYWCDPK